MNDKMVNQEFLIKKYEKTQDMMKHYDDITIRFGSISQSGVLIFIGLSFGLLSKQNEMFSYLFPFVILFVIMINVLDFMWFRRHRSISQIKIHRILEIEKEIGWKQFSMVDKEFKSKKIESFPVRYMILIYLISQPIILIIAYLVVIRLK